MNKYILALSALALSFSCARIEEENIAGQTQKVGMTFSAVMADGVLTKTAVDGVAGDAVRNLLWLPDDEIAVIATDGDGTVEYFHNNTTEKSSSASFSGSAALSDSYYGLFPYQSTARLTDNTLRFKMSATQKYAKESFGPKAMPMVAKIESGSELYFMNVYGGFIVNLTGTEKIGSIQFTGYDESGNKAKVSGEFTVDMNYEETPVIQTTGNCNTSVALDCGNDGVLLSAEQPTSFHIALPPATYHGFSLIITTTDGRRMLKESDKELTITRANLTNAAAFAFEENFYGFDLSEHGTANSYIISSEGFYHFDASVIGNGEFGMRNTLNGAWAGMNMYHTDDPSISPASAEVLWETETGMISGVSLSGGEISFTATGTEGNALIAAKDENDEILWSWHIWSTDAPQEHLYVNSTGNYTVLDRNLGATRADAGTGYEHLDAMGMFYQQGRKDPFYISMKNESENWMEYESHFTKIETQLTIAETIKMPNTYAYGNGEWNLNSAGGHMSWSGTDKSIYDPCPPGYRVAFSNVWYGFTDDGNYANRAEEISFAGEWDRGTYFYYDGVNTAWYPTNPRIDYWGSIGHESYYNQEGFIWTAESNQRVKYRYSSDLECHFNRTEWTDPVHGYPVRCMKDSDAASVIVTTDEVTNVTSNSAEVRGKISVYGKIQIVETGFVYGTSSSVTVDNGSVISTGNAEGQISANLAGLEALTKYYVRAFITTETGTSYGTALSFITPNAEGIVDLSTGGTANSYMVYPVKGTYTFDIVEGNSDEAINNAASAEVLWETFNTTDAISIGDIIESVELVDGTKVKFSLPEDVKAGNALIGVKNSAGKILWSWHIWVVDMDADATGVVYPSGAMMMDRNLGALTNNIYTTTEALYDVRAFGLFYQWGRKDPFVGAGSTAGSTFATTTLGEKTYIESGSDTNTKAYSISHPTTVISDSDWNKDSSLWGNMKTIYDPCPVGWRVPDQEIWTTSAETSMAYPYAGYTDGRGTLHNAMVSYYLWTNYSEDNYRFGYYNGGTHTRTQAYYEYSVRCMKDAEFTVTTGTATGITESSAMVSGTVTILDDTSMDVVGIVYSTDNYPKLNNDNVQFTTETGAAGEFTSALTGLKPNTTYYVRAYATGGYNTRYGETISFMTSSSGSGEGFDDGGDYEWE